MRKIARIFEDIGGIYVCDDDTNLLDTRGRAHPTKVAALMAAARDGYTHAIGSGTYWGNKVRSIKRWKV